MRISPVSFSGRSGSASPQFTHKNKRAHHRGATKPSADAKRRDASGTLDLTQNPYQKLTKNQSPPKPLKRAIDKSFRDHLEKLRIRFPGVKIKGRINFKIQGRNSAEVAKVASALYRWLLESCEFTRSNLAPVIKRRR